MPRPKVIDRSASVTKKQKLAEFEDYTRTSFTYAKLRKPMGAHLISAMLGAHPMKVPIAEQKLADLGCGSGNYIAALASACPGLQLHGMEYNPGMLRQAAAKCGQYKQRITLQQGSLLEPLPFVDNSFDAVVITQVIHHLETTETRKDFANVQRVIAEVYRILKPHGVFFLNTSSPTQNSSQWAFGLIPAAAKRYEERLPEPLAIKRWMEEAGFEETERLVPLDETLMDEEEYLDLEGPLREDYREADSTWALATPEELEAGLARLRGMIANGTAQQWQEEREAIRKSIGMSTFIVGRKRQPQGMTIMRVENE